MKRFFLAVALVFVAAAGAVARTEYWRDAQGRPVADTASRKSKEGFAGWLLITPDEDWKKKWETPSSVAPASREWLLHPGSAKSAQRRIRMRLVASYALRFGADEFAQRFSIPRIPPRPRSNWLPGGYAWWRERLLGHVAQPQKWPSVSSRATSGEA